MKKSALFHFACNDPDNGMFAGRVAMAQYGDIELEAPNWEGFAFTVGDGFIRIHRRHFKFIASKDWFGNWCWNVYRLPRSEAKRLIATLRKNGWRCTQGPCRLYDWWNQEGPRFRDYVRKGYVTTPAHQPNPLSHRTAKMSVERNLKAELVARAKSMLRLRDLLWLVTENLEDEGDRVYFGSSNDADLLREVYEDLEGWAWEGIIRDSEKEDIYEISRKAHERAEQAEARATALTEEVERLREEGDSQIAYSCDLQRIIEDLCANRPIRTPKTTARFHYDMAVASHRAALGDDK